MPPRAQSMVVDVGIRSDQINVFVDEIDFTPRGIVPWLAKIVLRVVVRRLARDHSIDIEVIEKDEAGTDNESIDNVLLLC